jgi:hypothetical protein
LNDHTWERQNTSDANRRSLVGPLAGVAALIVGVLIGFLLWGMGDNDSTAPVATGGAELTARQEQMVELMYDYEAAWQQGDREAIVSMFTEDGRLTIFGTEFEGPRISSGVSTRPSLDVLEPVVLDDSRLISFHDVSGYGTLIDVIEFTADGEVLIVSHEILR